MNNVFTALTKALKWRGWVWLKHRRQGDDFHFELMAGWNSGVMLREPFAVEAPKP